MLPTLVRGCGADIGGITDAVPSEPASAAGDAQRTGPASPPVAGCPARRLGAGRSGAASVARSAAANTVLAGRRAGFWLPAGHPAAASLPWAQRPRLARSVNDSPPGLPAPAASHEP